MTENKATSLTPWIMWGIVSIFYAYQYILRVVPSVMMDDVAGQFHMDATLYGQFSGIYYVGYSLMHLPLGLMLDRIGPRIILPIFIILTAIGLAPLIYTDFWLYPILGRAMTGIGSSAAILGIFKVVQISFKENQFTRMVGLSLTVGLLGAIYGGGPVSYLRTTFGFQAVVESLILMGFALAIATYFLIPKHRPSTNKSGILKDLKILLTNKYVLLICLFSGLMVGPLEGFADVWGSEFLKKIQGFDNIVASSLPSFIFMGVCCGGPILSFFATKLKNEFKVIVIAGMVMTFSFLLLLLTPLTPTVVSIIFFLLGIACAYQVLALYKSSTFVPARMMSLTTACVNMIVMMFGYLFHTAIGKIVTSFHATGSTESNSEGFLFGIGVVPLGLFIGTAGFLFLYLKTRTSRKRVAHTMSENLKEDSLPPVKV